MPKHEGWMSLCLAAVWMLHPLGDPPKARPRVPPVQQRVARVGTSTPRQEAKPGLHLVSASGAAPVREDPLLRPGFRF